MKKDKKQKEASIGALLVQIGKIRRNKTNAMLQATGIHAGQDILLYHLSLEDGQTVSALVDKIGIQHATMSNMADRMEKSGMIRREKDAADKRISRLFMTDKGKAAMEEIARTWKAMDKMTTRGMSKKEEEKLRDLLEMVLENLQ